VCSSVDAKKEAEGWIRLISPRLRGLSQVIVLGAGAGHHLVRLASIFAPSRILVIEKAPDCVKFCREHHSLEMTEIRFFSPRDAGDVLNSPLVAEFLAKPYTVLRFAPATHPFVEFYDQMEELLSGRTAEGFDLLLKCRPALSGLFKTAPSTSAVHSCDKKMISIKNLKETLDMTSESADALVIRALVELII
jgi:hypothetical protein